jgi:hypothetical protein
LRAVPEAFAEARRDLLDIKTEDHSTDQIALVS